MHQMSLSETNAAVYKERVVSFSRSLSGSETGCVSELITRTDDEFLKRVLWVKRIFDRLEVQKTSLARMGERRHSLRLGIGICRSGKTLFGMLEQFGIWHLRKTLLRIFCFVHTPLERIVC